MALHPDPAPVPGRTDASQKLHLLHRLLWLECDYAGRLSNTEFARAQQRGAFPLCQQLYLAAALALPPDPVVSSSHAFMYRGRRFYARVTTPWEVLVMIEPGFGFARGWVKGPLRSS